MKKHIRLLDLYRFLATVAVFLFHYTYRYFEAVGQPYGYPVSFPYFGEFGVSLLFVITAFLSMMSVEKETSARIYFVKRLSRLWPVYAICIVLTSIATWLFFRPLSPSVPQFLVNFTMLQKLVGFNGVDGAYWTLSYQLLFYGVLAVVIWLKKTKSIPELLLAWTVLCIPLSVLKYMGNNHAVLKLARLGMMSDYLPYFALGAFSYFLYRGREKRMLILCAACMALSAVDIYFAHGRVGIVMFAVDLCLMIPVIIRIEPPKWLDSRAVRGFSDISYPFYLLHQYIGYVILFYLRRAGMTSEAVILIPAAIIALVSIPLHRYVEIPAWQSVSKRLRQRNNSR